MGKYDLGIDIAKQCANFVKISGKTSILQTKPISKINIKELKFAPKLKEDVVQISSKLKNTVRMQKKSDGKYLFYDGDKCIGKASMGKNLSQTAIPRELPKEWYIPNGTLSETNQLPTYPVLHIDELVMFDKKGFFESYQKRNGGKKYGTMCMQKILEFAEQNGYGSRISLDADKWGSNIHPGKFYAKIGFAPGQRTTEYAQKVNERYYKGLEYVKKHPNMPEEVKDSYLDNIVLEQIDGRFIADGDYLGSRVYLTNPEVLRNYKI